MKILNENLLNKHEFMTIGKINYCFEIFFISPIIDYMYIIKYITFHCNVITLNAMNSNKLNVRLFSNEYVV